MAEIPTIPLDIIETIIDILATIDDQKYPSIKACSLTCRSFVHFCRKHIFACIDLDTEICIFPEPLPSVLFYGLLWNTPDIANYVRDLTFGFPEISNKCGDDRIYLELSTMLRKLTQIRRLTIDSRWDVQLNWTNVPQCLQDTLFHLLDLPTIDYVALANTSNFPLLHLTRCINLRHLWTGTFLNPLIDHVHSPLSPRSIVLDEYSMGIQTFEALDKILNAEGPNGLPVFDFQYLKKYSASLQNQNYIEMARQILERTNQLISIDLHVPDTVNELSGLFEMVSPSLKSLKRIILRRATHNMLHPLAGFPEQLKLMRNMPNALEELELNVYLPTSRVIEDAWGKLDDAGNDSRWSSLKTVSVHIETERAERPIHMKPMQQFPGLSSNKNIVFDLTINHFKVSIPEINRIQS